MPLSSLTRARDAVTNDRRERGEFVLRCRGLHKELGGGDQVFRLKGIDLDVAPGEIVVVIGRNGSGKTSFLKLAAGIDQADKGSLEYPTICKGQPRWQEVRKNVAYVPQEPKQWPGRLWDYLAAVAALHGYIGRDNQTQVDYILHRLGLEDSASYRWSQLSTGYKTRSQLAIAMVADPKLLILDEPLGPLDIQAQEIFLEDLADLAASLSEPVGIIISSQHLYEVELIATNVLVLDAGHPIYQGSLARLGEGLDNNTFELACDASTDTLRNVLSKLGNIKIERRGERFAIESPSSCLSSHLLRALLDRDIIIQYFRDISSSSRRLFKDI